LFQDNIDQKSVYHVSLAPLLPLLFDGYDICVLAYGQAGAGKTYTLAGPATERLVVSG
jgi:hypothetical protein